MTTRQVRAARGAIGALVAVLLGAAAHTIGGGAAPSPGVVAAVALLAWPFAVLLAGRRLAGWRVAATVLIAQLFLHVAFTLVGHGTAAVASPAGHHGAVSLALLSGPSVAPDASMTAMHVVAAAATIVVLYSGERMLRALARGMRSVFARIGAIAAPVAGGPLAATTAPVTAPAFLLALSSLSRRGPPALAAR
ncbi:hypothetical protein GCM10022200_12360 [Microbacterium awajiense]|uniref:Uncharacterized protein n=1 Tax=Microbacterium awajiense TaxID=415214 RepID=A0ABP7AFC7_9MICO